MGFAASWLRFTRAEAVWEYVLCFLSSSVAPRKSGAPEMLILATHPPNSYSALPKLWTELAVPPTRPVVRTSKMSAVTRESTAGEPENGELRPAKSNAKPDGGFDDYAY